MDQDNQLAWSVAGISFMALLLIAFLSVPAWVWLIIATITILVVFSGDLESAYRQQQYQEQQHAQTIAQQKAEMLSRTSEMSVVNVAAEEIAQRKPEIMETLERADLLKDLATIGHDMTNSRYMTNEELMSSLSENEITKLEDLRRFLQNG